VKPARATAILALREASKALMLAHGALVELGDTEKADELVEQATDVFELIAEVSRDRVKDRVHVEGAAPVVVFEAKGLVS
jgi:hypothetical protein